MTTRRQVAAAANSANQTDKTNDNHVLTKPVEELSKPPRVQFSLNLPLSGKHLVSALILRLILIAVGEVVDKYLHVPYTDVDYHIFTDAARYVRKGFAPYKRDTYRYTPLISYLCLPNLYVHDSFAKVLFSVVDMLTSLVVYKIALLFSTPKLARISSLVWLYNPIALVISSRGNADSIICGLVLLTLYYRLHNKSLSTGLFLGLSIHCRMYPLIFSLPIFLSYRSYRERTRLVLGTLLTLGSLTGIFYYLYGDEFIAETYLYHLSRTDVKHNYSVHFLSQYLNVSSPLHKFVPQLVLQVVCSVRFFNINDLPLCLFLQTYLFVTFSPVLTCQYFMWYISLLIPILPTIVHIKQIAVRFAIWVAIQLLWLVPAYYLEYRGVDVFIYVGVMSAAFFLINVNIIVKLVQFYQPMKKVL
ncbi:hypothetical protein M8J76_008919 [Diaphorina citri]|nr:hypothetical protein M8J75_016282 [Diaphorina citri]KAI5736970.1 hypothetical protein M8J76_008919 [Diaphorina citri]